MELAKILIVEDEGIVALDIQSSLERLGYQVCGLAATGEEAIQLALDTRPDLILMDIHLADEMDGIETADHICAVLDIPIIFVTAYSDQNTLERAKITQPFGYISKPLEIRELHTTIEISLYRHAMEKRERQNAFRFEQVFNTVAYGLILLDEECTIQIANQQARDYLRILTQADNLNIGDRLKHLNGRSIEQFLASSTGVLAQRTQEIVVGAPQERVFLLETVPLASVQDETRFSAGDGWVISIQDVTDARRNEIALRQQERLAAVGQLAAGIAHDFGNILASISLSAQIIRQLEDDLDSKSMDHLKRIRGQVQHATDLVSQILDFSRKSHLKRSVVDLVPLYSEWIKLLNHVMPENIHVHFRPPGVPCVVDADPTRMQQILWNLALNARDALSDGKAIEVALDSVAFDSESTAPLLELQGREWVSIRVSDDGMGIAPDVLPHIFEPFYTTKPPGSGTGLGLAQVFGIVQQHDGLIHVSSTPGSGSNFTVFLPAANYQHINHNLAEIETSQVVQRGHGERLLVVEDNDNARRALADSLTTLKFEVIEASNGEEALAILQNEDAAVQLVVTDHIMPKMGALEFCRELKKRGKDLPVIVVSGYSREEEVAVLKQLGVIDYMRKPVDLEHLSQLISGTLGEGEPLTGVSGEM